MDVEFQTRRNCCFQLQYRLLHGNTAPPFHPGVRPWYAKAGAVLAVGRVFVIVYHKAFRSAVAEAFFRWQEFRFVSQQLLWQVS